MLSTNNPYNTEIPSTKILQKIPTSTITKQLKQYLKNHTDYFVRSNK